MLEFWVLGPAWGLATVAGFILVGIAQFRVKSAFTRYSKVGVRNNMTGAEAAAAVCRAAGVHGVTIERHQGFLSDHYDPRTKSLRLSPDVYDGRSISSIAVAAHEAGHSIQDADGYGPLKLRSKLVPIATLGSRLWLIPFMIGIFMNASADAAQGNPAGALMMKVGVVMFAMMVLFQLVTLPVEFDASNRAKEVLAATGIVSTQEEATGVQKVLGAAAMTYVAATLAAVLQLIVLIMRTQGRNSN